jgi:cobalt-zinc-cadmium efflux system membrane fusion protein
MFHQNLVSISVPMGGYLKYTKLLEGMYVTKGQVLCVVEDQQHSIAGRLPLAKAKIGYAKSEFERQKSSIGARPAAIKYINLHNQNTIHYR